MSIYFNFNNSQLEFVLQQNKKEYFAVNFLNTHVGFSNIGELIDELFSRNDCPIQKLCGTSHIVVLPSVMIGYGMISVPKSLFSSGRDFDTKFNALYNKSSNMLYDRVRLFNKDATTTFAFTMYRQDILQTIENVLAKYKVKVIGFTTLPRAVNKFVLSKLPKLSANNFLTIYGEQNVSVTANLSNKVLCSTDGVLSKNSKAKTFAIDEKIELSVDNDSHNNSINLSDSERISSILRDYENYYQDYNLQFSQVVNLTSHNIENSIAVECLSSDVLSCVDKSIMLSKKGFFSL